MITLLNEGRKPIPTIFDHLMGSLLTIIFIIGFCFIIYFFIAFILWLMSDPLNIIK